MHFKFSGNPLRLRHDYVWFEAEMESQIRALPNYQRLPRPFVSTTSPRSWLKFNDLYLLNCTRIEAEGTLLATLGVTEQE